MATEIAVISDGRLSDPYPARELSREKIGLLMGGMHSRSEGGAEGTGAAHCALNSKSGEGLDAVFHPLAVHRFCADHHLRRRDVRIVGKNPATALYSFFVEPLSEVWSLHELAIKAAPLILIGVGLSSAFRSNNWNIGAEGQFIMGQSPARPSRYSSTIGSRR